MRIPGAALAVALSTLPFAAAQAEDAGFWRGVLSTGATTASSYLTSRDDHKLVGPLAEDAGSFVASAGAIRGPWLEAELQRLRSDYPQLQQRSDMELASALLAGER
ncbi:conserverd hypothetical protein [Pseudomonas citronellolis]|jgi:uncharacterized protein (TIGR02448 family)|uniref:DUF2388 domain-containing protein n=1 Tax=Pseudomonas citronellolis TaxID=53408 RepID=A0AAQ1KE99_9PSED|nr:MULTISPECIES: DUF2388 domain-containing protein [Pseudomonas]KSW24658.1 ribonucleotide reductase [Pseudomonas sp. ADP]AMO73986.1 hypothetical protein PcP3B5_04780 [Pseudomonas citronellolis]KWR83356.1 ribonucleotide reductase [Pseudomonas sp. PI1]MCL6689812.1 DUF2388 domain-containing protein [Pseudomonas sp. R3.Fl]MCP1606383.1 uncharacterized protein (TIGR02448 family) [Pseudomonas citronellolis]